MSQLNNLTCFVGKGNAQKEFDEIIQPLLNKHFKDRIKQIIPTTKAGDAFECARKLILEKECDLIVACGGDGTNNEVLNGIMSASNDKGINEPACAMAILPIGTGNDFARSIGLYDNHTSVSDLHARNIRTIASDGKVIKIDVGSVKCAPKEWKSEKQIDPDTVYNYATVNRYFLNECGAGFSASIIDTVNNSSMIFSKQFTFSFYSLWQQFTYENKLTSFEMLVPDANDPNKTTILRDAEILKLVAVSNGRYFGAGMIINPGAKINDGIFDVCTIGDGGIIDALTVVPGLYKGTHVNNSKIHTYKCKSFRAFNTRKDDITPVQTDGEIVGRLPAIWTMHASFLKFIVSSEFQH
jgi:diacylglycerol kinase (ATP)